MIRRLTAFGFGLLFGLGLLLSGMTDPDRVKAFLDFTGDWNPALALVMGGATATAMPLFAWIKRRNRSIMGDPLALPSQRVIDARLVVGSAIFGLGWGMAGICPGPGLVMAGHLAPGALVFVGTAILGARLAECLPRRRAEVTPVYSGTQRVLP